LLFGFAPRGGFAFVALAVFGLSPAASGHFVGEQTAAGQGCKHQNVLREGGSRRKREGIEEIGEHRADERHEYDLPPIQDRTRQKDGQEVEERKGEVKVHSPIGHGNDNDQQGRYRYSR
jgi:hypothetical protein